MITYTGHGWSELTIEDVTITPSYITDVPFDILEAAIAFKYTKCASIYFDCEGTSATLVFTPYDIYMILEEGETPTLKYFHDLYPEVVIAELLSDIIFHRDVWIEFLVEDDKDKVNKEFDRLIALIQQNEK